MESSFAPLCRASKLGARVGRRRLVRGTHASPNAAVRDAGGGEAGGGDPDRDRRIDAGATAMAELSLLPAATVMELGERVPPVADRVTVMSNGAAWATATLTRVGAVCATVAVKVKGLPGLLAR